jgi:hypothetical protein
MRYVTDLKKATLAEFDEVEADWRDSAEGWLREFEESLPAPEELDTLDADDALGAVESAVMANVVLAQSIEGDTIEWGKVAMARIKARAKAASK